MSIPMQMGFWSSTACLFRILVVVIILATVQAGGGNINDDRQHARRELGVVGFMGIDCGLAEGSDYVDDYTQTRYTSEEQYVTSGESFSISNDFMNDNIWPHLKNVRSFPQGKSNCYTLKPLQAKGTKYLIRATFLYGNYDSKNQTPEFDLYVDVNKWDSVKIATSSDLVIKEIIHKPATDYIHVCLVDTGKGTPFISAIELIPLDEKIYQATSGSLVLDERLDVGAIQSSQFIRYNDDIYGRIWIPFSPVAWEPITASVVSGSADNNDFKISPTVMETAAKPDEANTTISITSPIDPNKQFYVYMHFFEVEAKTENDTRKFDIFVNNEPWSKAPINPSDNPITSYSTEALSAGSSLKFDFRPTSDSTLPPILNAYEIYEVRQFPQLPSSQTDVDAVIDIKKKYIIQKNWQGDPCTPQQFRWDGVECSTDPNGTQIISKLSLSSSGLTKGIIESFSKLTSLQHLDLSNNSLTGTIPESLAEIKTLESLNLSGNKLSGSIPQSLVERAKSGKLELSVEGNPDLSGVDLSRKKDKMKASTIVLIVVIPILVLLALIAIIWKNREKFRRKGYLGSKARIYTHSDIERIIKNGKEIGSGTFSKVYLGTLEDGSHVAVKILNESSVQNSAFETEVRLQTRIHQKNLVSLTGYCSEEKKKVIVYEYMPEGNLRERLSDTTKKFLSWKERLQIAVDAAQGLDYLHNGPDNPIIHRDLKPDNILLTKDLRAKIADFGISKILTDTQTHLTIDVAGTLGYLDPEYESTRRLSEKSDIYSFGIILLELITCQSAMVKEPDKEDIHITNWVRSKYEEGGISSIIDPILQGEFNKNSAERFYEVAIKCSDTKAVNRMKLSDVLAELKNSLEMEMADPRNKKRG